MTKLLYGFSATALSLVLGTGATLCSLADETYVHIAIVKPELAHLDSEYVEARGFPNPMWVRTDSHVSGYGAKAGTIFWAGVWGNIITWSSFIFAVEVLLLLVAFLLQAGKRRKGADPD